MSFIGDREETTGSLGSSEFQRNMEISFRDFLGIVISDITTTVREVEK